MFFALFCFLVEFLQFRWYILPSTEGGEEVSEFERTATTAERIKEAMAAASKRQADLVRETGIDKGALSHYLKGKYEPKQDVVYKLAKALNVSEMWLWGYDCKKERTVEQIKNDALSDIIIRLRTDSVFWSAVKNLDELDSEQLAGVQQLISAFKK